MPRSFADLLPANYRGPGLSEAELSRAQEQAEAAFPADLCELLTATLPTGPGFPDWRHNAHQEMARWRKRLIGSFCFDLTNNDSWFATWGDKPSDASEAREVIAQQLAEAPELIPIYLHRAIPNEPLEEGNPVFSFWQAIDVIVYGIDLADYLRREFRWGSAEAELAEILKVLSGESIEAPVGLGRPIRFWTDVLV